MNKLSHATSRIPNKERSDVLAGGLAGKLDAEAESVSAALGGKQTCASIAPYPPTAPHAASSRLQRSTIEGIEVSLTVSDPKVAVAVVKTREQKLSRACLAAAARSMRTTFAAPPGADKVAEVSSGSSPNVSKTSARKDGNTVERMSAQGAASARCEPLPRARSI
jgi:hypothetical protein